jgi:hypothetical protein
VAEVKRLLGAAVERLAATGARDEALARFVPARRKFLITREARMESLGRVWRLGVLLLGRDGTLYATGSTTRATEPGRTAYQSVSAEVRRGYRAAAHRSGFAPGETVNFDAQPIVLEPRTIVGSAGPLVLLDDGAFVKWSETSAALTPFAGYLDDRLGLLVDPPQGAT